MVHRGPLLPFDLPPPYQIGCFLTFVVLLVWLVLVFVAVGLLLLAMFVGFGFCYWWYFGVVVGFVLLVLSLPFGVWCLLVGGV